MAVEAVACKLVSGGKFPSNREFMEFTRIICTSFAGKANVHRYFGLTTLFQVLC